MKKPRRSGRLPRWQERSVYAVFGLLVATGVAWLLLDKFVRVAGEFGPEHPPAEHWMLVGHGVIAYGFLIIGGTMVPVHIVLGWNTRRNLKSGLTLAGMCAILALSALGLYYIGDEISRSWVSVIHWSIGLVAVPVLAFHALIGRSGR